MIFKFYLLFVDGYKIIYVEKRLYIGELVNCMNMGLDKLVEVSVFVVELVKELVVKEKEFVVVLVKVGKV